MGERKREWCFDFSVFSNRTQRFAGVHELNIKNRKLYHCLHFFLHYSLKLKNVSSDKFNLFSVIKSKQKMIDLMRTIRANIIEIF
jgi:hypothetical protein